MANDKFFVFHSDLLLISFGQRFGPQQVAVNIFENIFEDKTLSVIAIVDEELAKLIAPSHRRYVKVPKNWLGMIFVVFSTIIKNRPTVCHFNFPPLYLSPLLLLMKVFNMKIVYSFHGGILFEKKRRIQRALFINQCKFFYDKIIANSKYSAQFLLQAKGCLVNKLNIIPNGIKIQQHFEKSIKNTKGNPVVLYVGRLEYIKGIDILIEAINLAKENLPEICLHIVGNGSKHREIKKLISDLGLEKNVFLHGFISEKEKNNIYSVCDMVVVPSRDEPFGIIILEAMLAGKPLIVSDRGALPELVKNGQNGLVVKLTKDTIAQAIFNLTVDKNLRKTISENNKITVNTYGWKKITKDYIQLYRTLMKNEQHQ